MMEERWTFFRLEPLLVFSLLPLCALDVVEIKIMMEEAGDSCGGGRMQEDDFN